MASYVRCLSALFLVFLSFSLQIHARDSKLFNKLTTKNSKDNLNTVISVSPTTSPAPAPAPESDSEVSEHGYGLYGSESYRYPPTTTDPVKSTRLVGEETYVPVEELEKKKHDFAEFETGHSNNGNANGNGNGNGYVSERQGMSDTRFLDNGKYYYDVGMEKKAYNGNGYGNEKEMSEYINEEDSYPENHGNGNEYVSEKQGMSDTRFLENGKYHYDVNKERMNENSYYHPNKWNGNGNGYASEKQGMSDTKFLENGKYYYDINNEKGEFENNYNENQEYYVSNNGNEHENVYNSGGNEFEREEKEEYNYKPSEYETQGRVESKKLPPNQYDSMEEYEKEQEYKQSQNEYVP